jgi:uncharacterized protein YabN with tetrapyrrole methylase and pyrophosphatase domain
MDLFIQEEDVDVYLLGSGLHSFLDITFFTRHILINKCKNVFCLHDLPSFEHYLTKVGVPYTNLMPLYYKDGRDRSSIYNDIVNHVINCGLQLKENRPVGLILHGHPLVFSAISERLIQKCKEHNFKLKIVPAVSALDRIFVDLQIDIGKNGIQIFSAASVIDKTVIPNPKVRMLLFQIQGATNHLALRNAPPITRDAKEIKDTLLAYYPANHLISIVESAIDLGFASKIIEVELNSLELAYEHFNYNASLYIPAYL